METSGTRRRTRLQTTPAPPGTAYPKSTSARGGSAPDPKAPARPADRKCIVEYVTDEYVQPDYPDDYVNVNCVLAFRHRDDAVLIDFQNGWVFDSRRWAGRAGAREAIVAALRWNEDRLPR